MEDIDIIRHSASFRILNFIYSCFIGSLSFAAARAVFLCVARSGSEMFASSEFRKLFNYLRKACGSDLYAMGVSSLSVILLCNMVLGRMTGGRPSYGNIAIISAAIIVIGFGRRMAPNRLLNIIRSSMTYRLLWKEI